MPLEKQVTSRELSQRLKELGVKQESLFDWVGHPVTPSGRIDWHLEYGEHRYDAHYSAFTVAELGEMLPEDTLMQKGDMNNGEPANWYVSLKTPQSEGLHTEGGVTEADARAKMFIHLIENKIITI